MIYVLDENGNIKIGPNGHPLVKGDDDKEHEIDAIGAQTKIDSITKESNERRKKLGEATEKLESFSGIEDPKAALSAMQKVGSMDDDKKKEMDNLTASINASWEDKQKKWEDQVSDLTASLREAKVSGNFSKSKAVKRTILTPSIAAKEFGSYFDDDGTAKDYQGNTIYSKEKPGTPAEFEESLNILIDAHPDKDFILKSSGAKGSGGFEGDGGAPQGEELSSVQSIKAGLDARGK